MFEQLENEVMSAISREVPQYSGLIMEQYIRGKKTREFTGHGFYTDFDDVGDGVLGGCFCDCVLGTPSAVLNNGCTVGFALFIRGGKISTLEGYTFGDEQWPDVIETYEVKNKAQG